MANLSFQCPNCQQLMEADAQYAGQQVQCPGCGQLVAIPGAMPPAIVPGNTVNCPKCGKVLAIQPEWAGMQVQCPECSAMMVIPGTPTVPPPPPPLPNVPPPPPPLVNHLMPPRFEQVQHSNTELASKFSDLKYRVDQLALRVMVRYPWWSLIIGVSSIWIPLFFRSKDRIDALWVIVGYALLVCLGRFAKKGWEAEPDDNSLVYVGVPWLLFFGYRVHWVFMISGFAAAGLLLGFEFKNTFEGDGTWEHVLGCYALFLCIPMVGLSSYYGADDFSGKNAVLICLMLIAIAIWTLLNLVQLAIKFTRWFYHAWKILPEDARWGGVAPGMAAGLLWVPVFNLL